MAAAADAATGLPVAPTTLPTAPSAPSGEGNAATSLPVGDAQTVNATQAFTSLDSPSPRRPVRAGDGPFQAGQQVGPRYTILKLLGVGGMGAVHTVGPVIGAPSNTWRRSRRTAIHAKRKRRRPVAEIRVEP